MHASGLLLVCAIAPQDRVAPVADGSPHRIVVGDWITVEPVAGDQGVVFELAIDTVEPLTVTAESYDCDVRIRIESTDGTLLAEDDDGGVETDASLPWTPTETGTVSVRLLAHAARGEAVVCVLRGELDPQPPEPNLAARAHQECAWYRARWCHDDEGASAALRRLQALADVGSRPTIEAELLRLGAALEEEEHARTEAVADLQGGRFDAAQDGLRVITTLVTRLAAPDSALVADLHNQVANLAQDLGDVAGCLERRRTWLAFLERTLPEHHLALLNARIALAAALEVHGDFEEARDLTEGTLTSLEPLVPDANQDLERARHGLAVILEDLGELAAARALHDKVLAIAERTLAADDLRLADARESVAVVLGEQGDLSGSRALFDAVLAVLEKVLPDDDPRLQFERANLATTMSRQGDQAGARALLEKVLAVYEQTLPPDHPVAQVARLNLATILQAQRDVAGARRLLEAVIASRERTLPPTHPDLLTARQNLATILTAEGDLVGARALDELALDVLTRTLPDDHPEVNNARLNLAVTLRRMGELRGAAALAEKALAVGEPTLPDGHPDLQRIRDITAWIHAQMGSTAALTSTLRALVGAAIGVQQAQLGDAARAREQTTLAAERSLWTVLSMAGWTTAPHAFDAPLFEWIERERTIGDRGPRPALAADVQERLEPLRRSVFVAREEVADQVAGLAVTSSTAAGDGELLAERASARDELATAVRARDRAERKLNQALVEWGATPPDVDAQAVARALPEGAAAAGLRIYTRWVPMNDDPASDFIDRRELVAFVVTRDAEVQRVDLGDLDQLETSIEEWRAAIGAPLAEASTRPRRGATSLEIESKPLKMEADHLRSIGERIRAQVLDPIVAAAGSPSCLYLCLDGALLLTPIEALPIGDGRVVGDQLRIRHDVSFSRLVSRSRTTDVTSTEPASTMPASESCPTFVALGGIDFDAEPLTPALPPAPGDLAYVSPPIARGPAGRTAIAFDPLRGTQSEIDAIAKTWQSADHSIPIVLHGVAASKGALLQAASRARWLHIATHGYFSTANVKWLGELEDAANQHRDWRAQSLEEHVSGMSPMTLCGLALAGANLGRDALGRVPGILTAEELAGLDLSSCELAVLSACETSVGIRHAGLGIHSLQKALHMAGAKTAITSLWKVDDERTCELMTDFYRRLWIEKKPKAVALWEAKCVLRGHGARLADWAGWILTGDPGDEPAVTSAK